MRTSLPRRGCPRRFPTSLTTSSGEPGIAGVVCRGRLVDPRTLNPRKAKLGRAGSGGGGEGHGTEGKSVSERRVEDGEFLPVPGGTKWCES